MRRGFVVAPWPVDSPGARGRQRWGPRRTGSFAIRERDVDEHDHAADRDIGQRFEHAVSELKHVYASRFTRTAG